MPVNFLEAKDGYTERKMINWYTSYIMISKAKISPTTHLWRRRGRGYIAPTHLRPRHWMGWVVTVTPRPRFTPGERTPVLIGQETGWASEPVWIQRQEEKSFRLCRGSNLFGPVVQSVARHCTEWATRLHTMISAGMKFWSKKKFRCGISAIFNCFISASRLSGIRFLVF
jgi:hypothetical protein